MSKSNFSVVRIKKQYEYAEWLLKKHYAHRIPSISYAFGLYENKKLCGVCTFGTPSSSTLLKGICGEGFSKNVIELNRLVVSSEEPNITSWFVSRCLNNIKNKIVVSYADTAQGHIGKIYQACNFIYTGLSSKFVDPKVAGLENQHHATYAHGLNNKQLKDKYGDRLYYSERPRKHRYVYFCGDKRFKKQAMKALKYEIKPYPKGSTNRYDAGGKIISQNILI